MRNFIIRILINAIAIVITAQLLPGIQVTNEFVPLLIVALVLTIVNAMLKPILLLLSCPLVLLTLGLFILVVNAFALQIAAYFSGNNFVIDGFWPAFWGGIIMAIVNMVLEGIIGDDDKKPAQPAKRG
ncbi:MAG: phage holin family protein [Anaerolineae bacterium]|nr:phage holin family protein [Anaerolineae bacterium]